MLPRTQAHARRSQFPAVHNAASGRVAFKPKTRLVMAAVVLSRQSFQGNRKHQCTVHQVESEACEMPLEGIGAGDRF